MVSFVCIIGQLLFWNLTKNPSDFETRAQELTSGAIGMFLSLFVEIWENFKDERVWRSKCSFNFRCHFDIFYEYWYFLALDRPISKKLVTKLKSFWCFNWFWKNFGSIWPQKNFIHSQSRWKKSNFNDIEVIFHWKIMPLPNWKLT